MTPSQQQRPIPAVDSPVSPEQTLAKPLQFVRGVGADRAALLAQLGLHTARDLLFFFPRTYEPVAGRKAFDELCERELQTVRGVVADVELRGLGPGRSILGVLLSDGKHFVRGTWFNQPYWREKFREGQTVLFTGKPRFYNGRWEFNHPRIVWLDGEDDAPPADALLPVYRLTEGISQPQMRKLAGQLVKEYASVPAEAFPSKLLTQYALLPIEEALRRIHAPANAEELEAARYRLVFQELLILQLALALRRWQQQAEYRAPPLPTSAKIDARIKRLFPFELTDAQRGAIDEVAADMALDRPMNRLLQGDVGSGKTVVALYAMLLAVANNHQAVLMAPTEILARQHARTLSSILQASRVRWNLLTGSTTSPERSAVLSQLAAGELDVLMGTHAILQDSVEFADLGVVVIDEQHKFGVRQRASLRRGSVSPHYLVMTATPIPRTMTMAMFGDLDVSVLRDLPPGRKQVHTYVVAADRQRDWWKFVRDKVNEGRQAYVIAPLVDESDHVAARSAEQTFEALANGELASYRAGLLHGRMSPAQKSAAMDAFVAGESQVLISTSVVEVGVDVPNATVMTIYNPDRFGLAQLHQMRGRICRGQFPGYCGLLLEEPAEDQSELAENERAGGDERLQAFATTADGFELAEVDFRLRGPGDLFGTRQHGMPPLRIADLVRDSRVVEEARKEAQLLVAADPGLRHRDHAALRRMVLVRYGSVLELGDAG